LIPALNQLVKSHEIIIRSAVAKALPRLMKIARRFLELSESLEPDQSVRSFSKFNIMEIEEGKSNYSSFDSRLLDLLEGFQELVVSLFTEREKQNHGAVKLLLIDQTLEMCQFFGRSRSNEMVLSYLVTCLNDHDANLRRAFLKSLTTITDFVGFYSFEQYFLPLMVQSLADENEHVIQEAIQSLTFIVKSGVVKSPPKLRELLTNVVPHLAHPNKYIRKRECK
jgi:phosphoinositide-3-kinase regulatory subunit 4